MAEFCLECLNKQCGKKYTKRDVVLSKEPDICEGCGKWKPVVISLRWSLLRDLFGR